LTLVGEGPRRKQWQRLAARLGLAEQVDWLPWQPHEQMPAIYRDHDIFLFPSLHDSGGFVVLEAMKEGLPVVCLNLGGPSVTVTNACGRVVEVKHKSRRQVIRGLGDALIELSDPEKRTTLTAVARQRCRELTWQRKIERIYGAA
jgi:glycosyltransferase involved in cell wall biosynthesis